MKKIGIIIIIGILGMIVSACQRNTPSGYRGFPKEYTTCYQEIYGHCYDSIPHAVVALDLYSEGLELDKEHRMKGTGYNLYLSDVIVPDSLLEEGNYRSDISAEPFTFLPGRDFEGTPHGMYLLTIEEGQLTHIQVLDSGRFAYRNDSLLFTLYYKNSYGYRVTYSPVFHGTLLPWVKQ